MGGIDQNLEIWTESWDWSQRGDEWSAWWGGSEAMWYGALLPRIHAFLPAPTILEIAPGYGRWTHYLKDQCERLVIVDLSANCIEHCRERFADEDHIRYVVNDGRSLDDVEDKSIDFAFTFDSLVHVDAEVIGSYLRALARKLTPDGVGFFHHSNAGAYREIAALARRTPQRVLRRLVRRGLLPDLYAWRDETMTAAHFAELCGEAGLVCMAQERISWESGRYLIDALSLFTPVGSRWRRRPHVARNPRFGAEGRRMAALYAFESRGLSRPTPAPLRA